ncbi:mycothiol system anti-sigma-R factor [Streptomyces sp. NPDC059787]|uniref:mycothiol system anti-sigma-R factor n=1 Tax=Streptomyces sp. NPDC059787 TaxID=3346947 RepID=UPI003655DB7D
MDCADFLDRLYEFLDGELSASDAERFAAHLDECSSCLEKYGMEQAVKRLIKRACSHDDVPIDLRAKVMGRIELIRRGGVTSHDSSHQDVTASEQ